MVYSVAQSSNNLRRYKWRATATNLAIAIRRPIPISCTHSSYCLCTNALFSKIGTHTHNGPIHRSPHLRGLLAMTTLNWTPRHCEQSEAKRSKEKQSPAISLRTTVNSKGSTPSKLYALA